jgi:hypothetical protein
MATTTPNYGWPVPTSTDYVKDGATAIEALGDAIDATVFGLGSGLTHISTSTLSANANLQVNNVFTSSFANYRIVISMTTSANSKIYMKTSESGTPSGTYGYNNAFFSNVTVLARSASFSSIPLGNTITAAEIITLSLDVFSPQLNAKTQVMGNYFQFLENGLVSGARTTAAQSDGFFLDLDSGTMTGTVRVYGYENS